MTLCLRHLTDRRIAALFAALLLLGVTQGHLHKICPEALVRDVVKLAAHESRDNGHFVDSLLLFLRVHRIDVVLEILCSQLV